MSPDPSNPITSQRDKWPPRPPDCGPQESLGQMIPKAIVGAFLAIPFVVKAAASELKSMIFHTRIR